MFKIGPIMAKIDPKMFKISSIDPKIFKKSVNYSKNPTHDKKCLNRVNHIKLN